MLEQVSCASERLPFGGQGCFMLGRSEALSKRLSDRYAQKVQLIYLDPPFGTGDTFSFRSALTGKQAQVPAYSDRLSRDDYLCMMRGVLSTAHELLSPTGCIYVHIDYRMSAHIKLMLDDIFGESNFVNEIIWAYKSGGRSTRHYSRKHDTIYLYRKSRSCYFDITSVGYPRGQQRRNHMKRSVDENGRICFSIRSGGKTYKYYEDEHIYPSDVWSDIEHLHQRDPERTGFSTQKPAALLKRIIAASSKKGDIVADLFSGSGTTACTAAAMERNWLAADMAPVAMATLRGRLAEAHSGISMFEAQHVESVFEHEQYENMPDPIITFEHVSAQTHVTLSASEPASDISYFAVGVLENGCFTPSAYSFDPSGSFTLIASADDNCVQVADITGRQNFYLLR